jgi:hypothetical protein
MVAEVEQDPAQGEMVCLPRSNCTLFEREGL